MEEAEHIVALVKVNLAAHLAPLTVGIGKDSLAHTLVDVEEEVLSVLAGLSPAYLALHAGLRLAADGHLIVAALVAHDVAPLEVVVCAASEQYGFGTARATLVLFVGTCVDGIGIREFLVTAQIGSLSLIKGAFQTF